MFNFKKKSKSKRKIQKPILLSIGISIGEIILYFLVSWLAYQGTWGIKFIADPIFWSEFVKLISDMIMAIVTTWYVVFTYYILKATDNSRKQSFEPFLAITWSKSAQKEEKTFNELNKLGLEIVSTLKNYYVLSPNEESNEYINIEIENVRVSNCFLKNLTLELEIVQPSHINLKFKKLGHHLQNCNLEIKGREKIKITVISLEKLPNIFDLKIKITGINYSAPDSDIPLDEIQGSDNYTTSGSWNMQTKPIINQ